MILMINSAVDYFKDRRFLKINSLVKDEDVIVIRSKDDQRMKVSVWDLVVGDLIVLELG